MRGHGSGGSQTHRGCRWLHMTQASELRLTPPVCWCHGVIIFSPTRFLSCMSVFMVHVCLSVPPFLPSLKLSEAWPIFPLIISSPRLHTCIPWIHKRAMLAQRQCFWKAGHQHRALSDSFACVIITWVKQADEHGSWMCVSVQRICIFDVTDVTPYLGCFAEDVDVTKHTLEILITLNYRVWCSLMISLEQSLQIEQFSVHPF